MILCPACKHKELVGALFCSECGTQLVFIGDEPLRRTAPYSKPAPPPAEYRSALPEQQGGLEHQEHPLPRTPVEAEGTQHMPPPDYPNIPPAPPYPPSATGALVSLCILPSREILPLGGQGEITLGRVGENQPIVPDVDLSPYGAYQAGVSRLHASIVITSYNLKITDLGSANGTRLNGQKIPSHVPHALKNGDLLQLGRLQVQILIGEAS